MLDINAEEHALRERAHYLEGERSIMARRLGDIDAALQQIQGALDMIARLRANAESVSSAEQPQE